MERLNLKPTHKSVQNYYEALRQFKTIDVSHEGAVRSAFQNLLEHCGRQFGWKLVPEWPIKRDRAHSLRVDGALVDEYRLTHGFWEAKDSHDDLAKEVKKKLTAGYPQNNIIFQAPERAILWQNGRVVLDEDITEPVVLVEFLKRFFDHTPPELKDWDDAVTHFQNQVPELGQALKELIEKEQKSNSRFRAAFDDFYALCRQSINPNLSREAVEEMLIQHLLTERIFRTVFNNPDFTRRNVIAAEIEKVIDALTSQAFSREGFLQSLDRFYKAIDTAARTIEDFSQKQLFLNTVYEKFFQGFSVKVADTHGVVYTPQPIVNFMVLSVEDILQKEFGKSLSSPDVHILDPFVGTGNFIVHIMQAIKKTALSQKYKNELHCNEVMLLPYYIASMNIEHEYYEQTKSYGPFEGICLVDTFELAEGNQLSFFSAENTARVERQKRSPIRVIIGNPPYNVGQLNENDNNKNRKYKIMDKRVSETYARDSKATLVNKLNDPYVKAIRWASDRISKDGIVAFVSNNSFLDNIAFDGMRRHLTRDFSRIIHLNLKGNARTSGERRKQEGGNIFDDMVRVGVGITFFIRNASAVDSTSEVSIFSVDDYLDSSQKRALLEGAEDYRGIPYVKAEIDDKDTWVTEGLRSEYGSFLSLANRGARSSKALEVNAVFKTYSLGVSTNRDSIVYDFDADLLSARMSSFAKDYNSEIDRFRTSGSPKDIDNFLSYDRIKWSRNLKRQLRNGHYLKIDNLRFRRCLYRPFADRWLYFSEIAVDEYGQMDKFFPTGRSAHSNQLICVSDKGFRSHFSSLMASGIVDLHVCAGVDGFQCLPRYTYREDGTNRRENITDWALAQFQEHYADKEIAKADIFYYVYAILHHPLYRERYAANLKRELPRIPFAPDFRAFADIGKRLAEIHVDYEQQPEYALEKIESSGVALDWRVEKMKLSKDKRKLSYNDFLTLSGIPPEVFEYRLGNRSALDWIIDQYQVSTDKRSGITNDPNRADDPEYIVRLIGQVITVSLETVKLVASLSALPMLD